MRFNRFTSIALAATCLAGAAQAQNINFNEIYASHTGTDDQEFIELIGTPGMSLNGIVVCMVEGQGGGQGVLDRVWDLSGLTMPMDGYFVLGNAIVPNMDYDLANGPHTTGGLANNIENGTETFYLLNVPNPLDIDDLTNSLNNTNIDPDGNGETLFSDDPTNFITLENLTLFLDTGGTGPGGVGPHDITHDCAAILGPAGTFFPAGVSRSGDYPNDWCGDVFLDFSNPGGPDQTPGAANPVLVCGTTVVTGTGCTGTNPNVGTPFCDPSDLNSTGLPTTLTGTMGSGVGSGLHLESAQGPANGIGYVLVGTATATPGIALGSGHLCFDLGAGQTFGRYNVSGTAMNSIGIYDAGGILQNIVGTSTVVSGFDVPSDLPSIGGTIQVGQTWHFQVWHRDTPAGVGTSNFSNGLSVTF
jgi:hypothetical protein